MGPPSVRASVRLSVKQMLYGTHRAYRKVGIPGNAISNAEARPAVNQTLWHAQFTV